MFEVAICGRKKKSSSYHESIRARLAVHEYIWFIMEFGACAVLGVGMKFYR